ncbi:peptidyl-prolyl cis-trans isomerase G isoform X2 [Procambarus clarkii]|uniref:peptidyl-prolyl cis-trans isomerase G isoform X2 n=1 Tax=Procambarus clarkii TaxID=6728 RepID=UPI0037421216
MNWVGGVRRRVLLREEERRRQEQFFAAHASSAKHSRISQESSSVKPRYVVCCEEPSEKHQLAGSVPQRPRIGSQRWRSEGMVCERIKKGSASTDHIPVFQKQDKVTLGHYSSSSVCGGKNIGSQPVNDMQHGSNINRKNSRICLIRPTSIHGPFSRFLLKLEMEGIEKKSRHQHLLRGSEGRRCSNRGESVKHQESETHRIPAGNHESKNEEKKNWNMNRKVDDNRNSRDENISQWDMKKDIVKNKSEKNEAREENGNSKRKEKEASGTQSRSKRIKTILQVNTKYNLIQNETGSTETEENTNAIRNGKQQAQSINKSRKQQCILEENDSSHHEIKDEISRDDFLRNKLHEGSCAKYNPDKINSYKKKKTKVTYKIKDNVRQDLSHIEAKHNNYIDDIKNKQVQNKKHTETHKCNKRTKVFEDTEQNVTLLTIMDSDFDTPERVDSKPIKEHKVDKKGSEFYSKNRAKKSEENNRNKKSNVFQQSGKNKKRAVNSISTSSLMIGAPRVRQMLSLSPERHKGRIWAPLKIPQESFIFHENEDYHDSQGKYEHPKHTHAKTCNNTENNTNSEWEIRRIEMLLGSQFDNSSATSTVPYDIYRNTDQIQNYDTWDHSHNKSAMPMLTDSPKKNVQLTAEELNNFENHENALYNGARRLGERRLQVLYKGTDKIQLDKSHKVKEIPVENKPKLSTFTRKIEKIESGLSFAHQRKDKTPYLDRSFGTSWNLSNLISTPNSKSSSKTPTDPTFERSLEDLLESQGGSELCCVTADNSLELLLNFEINRESENNSRSIAREVTSHVSSHQVCTENIDCTA